MEGMERPVFLSFKTLSRRMPIPFFSFGGMRRTKKLDILDYE